MLSQSHQIFLKVAHLLSFSRAAEILYISQSAVSRHIQALETHYNCALFERSGRDIKLTDIGLKIANHLNDAMDIQRKLEYEVSSTRQATEASGSLILGSSTTVSLYILPGILSEFHKTHPQISLHVVNRNTENITQALLDKTIDVGIVEVEHKRHNIHYDYFTSDYIIAVCSPKSPLAKIGRNLQIQTLPDIDVVLRENGSGTLSAIQRVLAGAGVSIAQLKPKIRLGGTEALKNFILADLSLGFLSQYAVKHELTRGDLVEVGIDGLQIKRDFYFITRQGESFELIKKFIRFAKRAMN